ncbi:hypothetical protein AB0H92_05140 [Streptomyces phaeochromogenes]|uniref:hypothetical protein n=1 Tax=Streptomyces phaeochromogenes TaxID=1923 RepID=UPI0033D85E00
MLRTYVSRLRQTLEPDRAVDESRAVIVSAIDRYLAFAVPEVGEDGAGRDRGNYARTYSNGTCRVVAHPEKEDLSEGVGEIAPRTCRTSGDLSDGYWEPTMNDGGIIDNQFATSAQTVTVTVAPTDGQSPREGAGPGSRRSKQVPARVAVRDS